MKHKSSRLAAAAACLLLLAPFAACSCSGGEASYRVALVGFEPGVAGEERNVLAEYGQRRVEAELGVEVDFILSTAQEELAGLFAAEGQGYDLVVSLGQDSSQAMLASRPGETETDACALDFEYPQPIAGEEAVSLVRYRVEEGAYLCGYLAGWLTARNDHPLTNPTPVVAFIGAKTDPLLPYYNIGFLIGVRTGLTKEGTFVYHLETAEDSQQARASAEEAVGKGADIIFCTPGPFNAEVIEVAEEKDALVILVGADRSAESPDHVLTSLLLRDDNAFFAAVGGFLDGDLQPGRQAWGSEQGTWSLAPFHGHDPYIRRELKEKLREQEKGISSVEFK